MSLLHEFIELSLDEAVRDARFSLGTLKKMKSSKEMLEYCNRYLKQLGHGSSRRAYVFSSRYVIKVARNDAGKAQNEAEVDVYTNPKTKPIVTAIYDYDPNYRWIIAEIVKEFSYMKTRGFSKALDTDVSFQQIMNMVIDPDLRSNVSLSPKLRDFIESVEELADANDLAMGDISVIDHWGLTTDGRIVLLDYGATHDVLDAHYSDSYPSGGTSGNVPQDNPTKKSADLADAG